MNQSADTPVRHAYDAWAGQYDSDSNKTRDLDATCLVEAGLDLAGKRVVEFGAGTGKNTVWLGQQADHVLAMDISPGMLDRARDRNLGSHVTFIEHDVTRPWPVASGSVDLVVGNLVLEHVASLAPVFEEAARVLRPAGVLYLAELHPFRQLQGSQARFEQADGTLRHVDAWYHGVSDYCSAARAAGLHLRDLREPADAGITVGSGAAPRLLVMQFAKAAGRQSV
ncbi:class I SAM-dependent methyltransferase [Maricaulis sp.]|uniref:class I SAM-dependent methyltransferase n=1 Tax=Maricaulis sp. TaxID=1486257 RepID=UPI002B27043C|nr:class I SAM-dependent methyltransferase [Maricaulis sp.]